MTISNLERVMWRIRKKHKNKLIVTNFELRRAMMFECGTDPRTLRVNRRALLELGWIKPNGTNHVTLTNNDITEE